MATLNVSFIDPVSPSSLDAAYPVAVESITTTASNQATTAAATRTGQTVVVAATGGDVWIAIGAAPDATVTTSRRLVPSGQVRAFGGVQIGHKVAGVNA